jgi:multisubunit Na+/H+ antiporter MnhB subunit
MDRPRFKAMSRGLVVGLVLVIALVAYNVNIPKGRSSSKNWHFVFTHPTILLHVLLAVAVVVVAIALLLRSIRSRRRSWVLMSAVGLAFLLLAFSMGERYVDTLSNSSLSNMGIGWFGATVTYGAAWYLNRKELVRAE